MYLQSDYFTFHSTDMDALERLICGCSHDVMNDVYLVCALCGVRPSLIALSGL